MLYPRESESREVKDLCGFWNFKIDKDNKGLAEKWYQDRLQDPQRMPVPASFNDIVKTREEREHVGIVWYDREFIIPGSWKAKRIFVRIDAAAHHSIVWVNGSRVASHKGGFLPFDFEITEVALFGQKNRISISVDNRLDWSCLPPGELKEMSSANHPSLKDEQIIHFDFYNYSGIHRPVRLLALPSTFISDITVNTDISGTAGIVNYSIDISGEKASAEVTLYNADNQRVGSTEGLSGKIQVPDARFWEAGNAYLYRMEISLFGNNHGVLDCYSLPVGIRTVEIKGTEFLLNGKPFYFKGFGMHEDNDVLGKALSLAHLENDFRLLKWIGANSVRTSHYPYSEEFMELADLEGIVVIDEVPAAGMNTWDQNDKIFCESKVNHKTLQHHQDTIRDLIRRDKNHPCVVMWSLANEAATYEEGALPYFEKIAETARSLDSRPITSVSSTVPEQDRVMQLFDVICFNRYHGWYSYPGKPEMIDSELEKEIRSWFEKYRKPIILTEFGADAIAGFHGVVPQMFSEEYQSECIQRCQSALDRFDYIIGEHVWNFSDFATKQGITRAGGNKKGVFTRQRQPKAAAFLLRKRWKSEV